MSDKLTKQSDDQWLKEVFQQTPDGIILQDYAGTILEANASFSKLCNQPLKSIVGHKFVDLLSPGNRAQWIRILDKLIKGEWSDIEETCTFADGRKVPIEVALVGKIVHRGRDAVSLHVRNVSLYRTVATALMASQSQWELSFNAIDDAMLILDRNSRILRANQAALTKITPSTPDPIGAAFFDIFQPKENAEALAGLRTGMFSEPCAVPRLEFAKFEGKYSLHSYPIRAERAPAAESIVIIRDITEQCRQEELLKRIETQRQKHHRIEALGRLAGSTAHDFNNILTTLLGYISLVLQSDNLGSNERTYLVEIMRTVERGTALTRQLFDFSTEKKSELKPVDLNAVIRNMQKMLHQILGSGIIVSLRLDEQLWNVNADVSRIERIITNLAINSRDAMPAGGQFIIETMNTELSASFCKIHPEIKPGNYIILQVADTGTGMPPEVLERIFEPFFTTKKKGKGTGLGLTSVFAIVRHFGGQALCYSEVGKGTTFKVYLPQSTDKQTEKPQISNLNDLPGGSETVLVVDDEIHIVSMLSQILTKIGYKVFSSTNSSQAISLCKEYKGQIDVVLSDIIMPDMNGVELVAILREKRPNLKAIFMSGYTSSMAAESVGLDKNTVFLQKPFTFEDLARKVRDSLDKPSELNCQSRQNP